MLEAFFAILATSARQPEKPNGMYINSVVAKQRSLSFIYFVCIQVLCTFVASVECSLQIDQALLWSTIAAPRVTLQSPCAARNLQFPCDGPSRGLLHAYVTNNSILVDSTNVNIVLAACEEVRQALEAMTASMMDGKAGRVWQPVPYSG